MLKSETFLVIIKRCVVHVNICNFCHGPLCTCLYFQEVDCFLHVTVTMSSVEAVPCPSESAVATSSTV